MKNRGLTLIELLVALGLVSLLVMGLASYFTSMGKAQQQARASAAAQLVQGNLRDTIRNEHAWTVTLNAPENHTFECLRTPSDCGAMKAADGARLVVVKDAENKDVLKHGATDGFDLEGRPCEKFPSVACPLKATLSWRALCPAAPEDCVNPQIELSGAVTFSDGSSSLGVNAKKNAFVIFKTSAGGLSASRPGFKKMCDIFAALTASETMKKILETMSPELSGAADFADSIKQAEQLCNETKED